MDHDVLRLLPLLQPHCNQHGTGKGAGQEADGEDHHNGQDHPHRSPQFDLFPNRLLPQPVDDTEGAEDEDDEREDDLAEEDDLEETKTTGLASRLSRGVR